MVKIIKKIVIVATIAIIYLWSIQGTGLSPFKFIDGIPYMVNFVQRMFPPDTALLPRFLNATLETIQIAILGTTLGVFLAVPVGLLAAENIAGRFKIFLVFRAVANAFRGVSEIVWALLFVATVGLGPFPGILALTVHSAGALAKFFAEAIENIQEDTISTVMATGASKVHIIFQGIIPEVVPHFITYILYYFEHNIRAATILGLVGAGGVGFELITSIKLFKYGEVLTIVLLMLALITVIDRLSNFFRIKYASR